MGHMKRAGIMRIPTRLWWESPKNGRPYIMRWVVRVVMTGLNRAEWRGFVNNVMNEGSSLAGCDAVSLNE